MAPVLPERTSLSDALEVMRSALKRAAAEDAEWRGGLARLQAHGLYAGVGAEEA